MAASTAPVRPRVLIVSPAAASANNGNWHTAARWQGFLAPVAEARIRGPGDVIDPDEADLLIALHARRSAEPIERWRAARPAAPIAVVLTGTDLYRDLEQEDPLARHSLECASRVVVLQDEALRRLDAATRDKAVVIVQSARGLRIGRGPADAELAAVGHLRSEKDPATLLQAVRLLAAEGVEPRIDHVGGALDEKLAEAARATAVDHPHYRWLGGLDHAAARRTIARARALVHPSVMEGGANVVIEAVRSGVPVLASRIDGNVGLLGADYDGFFPVADAPALAALMRRFLADRAFAGRLAAQCAAREPRFMPAAERRAVRGLVAGLLPAGRRAR